ncbi:LppP/LprE family lipoprotein [Corynebacterium urealyticum]|uniref:LppP/LprE family lipoprotein n=1 Tax=Corynebacterium urealyticum TaxID=43771 RepID=UPI00293E64F0|nr:LppP/LprE family lipoprotein [Corynebacterium urealyticum]WOH94044.1 LppP/LprE family lipoprotein [Corynebacterium urealyticum]
MRHHNVAPALALSCALAGTLAACSGDDSTTDATGNSAPTSASQSSVVPTTATAPQTTESSPKHKPEPTRKPRDTEPRTQCGNLSAQELVATHVDKLPPPPSTESSWDTERAGIGLYDPCAELSPIDITVEGATATSPHHIMLFHKGEYLGTATPEPRSFAPDMKLLNTQTVSVTYYYAKPGDPKDQPSGRAHVNFIWDHAKKKVIMDGNLPPRG